MCNIKSMRNAYSQQYEMTQDAKGLISTFFFCCFLWFNSQDLVEWKKALLKFISIFEVFLHSLWKMSSKTFSMYDFF